MKIPEIKTTNNRSPGLRVATALILGCALASVPSLPATAADPAPEQKGWESTAAAGLTLTRGNSKTLLATLGLGTQKKWESDELFFGLVGGYGENNDVKNNEFINGFGQYNHLFTKRFYAGLRVDGSYDGIAALDYRIRITPQAGYYLIKETNTTLAVEAGPALVFEKHKGQDEQNYWGVRLAERFEHKLTATTKIWEGVDYVPRVDDWSNQYVITGEVGIDTAITKQWSLRVVFQDIYDNNPTPGREKNDLRLVAGTAFKF